MNELLQLDQALFYWINNDWHTPWLDAIMPYWRDRNFWIPLYAVGVALVVWKYRMKSLYLLLAIAMTIAIADQTSSELIKKNVKRLRPCNDPEVKTQVDLLIPCGVGYSFTSSHAANHFALAAFLGFTVGRRYRRIRVPLYLWAASIALGQVYVGVHYPLDITMGALLGVLIGWAMSRMYLRWFALEGGSVGEREGLEK